MAGVPLAEPVLDWRIPCDADGPLAPLDELVGRARTGDATHLRSLAAGLVRAGRLEQAAQLLFDLASAVPDEPLPRVDLAAVYFQGRHPEAARQQLAAAAALCEGRPGLAETVARRAAQLGEWLRWSEEYFTHQELRAGAMRERVAVGVATLDDRVALARSLLSLTTRRGGGEAELAEAVAVLEEARRLVPAHVPVLELLVAAYGRAGDRAAMHAAERDLERRAPHSAVLDATDGHTDARTDELERELYARVDVLGARALQRDRDALDELRALHRRIPSDLNLPGVLLIAEMAFGHRDEVRRLADEFAARGDLHHAAHFNLAQAYWYLDRPDLGRHHFDRADALAPDDGERRDIAALRARLEAWDAR
jgi:predicted Zn-dependent protease